MTNEAKHVTLKMRLISRNDAADMLGCSIQTVSNWVECGAIKSHRIGNKLYIDKQSVEKLLDERRRIQRPCRKAKKDSQGSGTSVSRIRKRGDFEGI